MLNKYDMTAEKLDRYLDIKTELLASGHSENDFELVLKGINLVKENGYNLLAIAAQFSEHEQLKSSVHQLHVQESILERNARQLKEKAKISEQIIESKSQMQWLMVKLEAMGFGLKQLKLLYNVIKETAEANGFSETDGYAVKMFLEQVERNYDNLLGFEKRIKDLKAENNNLRIERLGQENVVSALPYVGSALARLLNRGLREDQIVKLANIFELHPDMIQSYLQDNSGNEGEQHKDEDFKSISSLSSSPFPYSTSLASSSSPSQPQSPSSSQKGTTPTLQKSASGPPLTEPYSTDKESDIQSFAPSLLEQQPSMKVQHNSPGVAVVVAPKQGASTYRDKSSQPADMRAKEDNQNQDQVNPTLMWTPTFLGMEIRIPKSIHLGANQSLKSPDSNSDQIETLPVASITASSRINNNSNNNNNSDPPNLLLNVLDGNFETSWSNKERGSWLSLDLGTTKNIQSVAIAWYLGDSFDYYYSISLSNDGIIFTEVKRGCSGGNSRSFQQYILKAGYRARYIKITVNGNNMNDMAGITQVEVLGSNLDS